MPCHKFNWKFNLSTWQFNIHFVNNNFSLCPALVSSLPRTRIAYAVVLHTDRLSSVLHCVFNVDKFNPFLNKATWRFRVVILSLESSMCLAEAQNVSSLTKPLSPWLAFHQEICQFHCSISEHYLLNLIDNCSTFIQWSRADINISSNRVKMFHAQLCLATCSVWNFEDWLNPSKKRIFLGIFYRMHSSLWSLKGLKSEFSQTFTSKLKISHDETNVSYRRWRGKFIANSICYRQLSIERSTNASYWFISHGEVWKHIQTEGDEIKKEDISPLLRKNKLSISSVVTSAVALVWFTSTRKPRK